MVDKTKSAPTHKRIVIACDGTWVNSDNGFERDSWMPWRKQGKLATSSNVTRLCRALLPKSSDGVQQIVYYQGGLGSANNWYSYVFGGFFGLGISENIREAYAFICTNYEPGDEIILTGFSRGAFTARTVGGLISSIGLLTRHGLGTFYPVFKDWENQTNPNHEGFEHPNLPPVRQRPKFKDGAYARMLTERELTRPNVPIKAIGVWDTVGSLGVPTIKLFGFSIHTDTSIEYSFINSEVAPNVEHAYQALALDEVRSAFSPTVWEKPDPSTSPILKKLKQTWFPGVHTSIGGGYEDTSISDITLAWMITQLAEHLSFDPKYVPTQREQNEAFYKRKSVPPRTWAMGLLQRSDTGVMGALGGRTTRTPGEYHATDPDTGKTLPRKLTDTSEFIHPSVRYRRDEGGHAVVKGVDDSRSGVYQAKALQGWEFIKNDQKGVETIGDPKWARYGKWVKLDKDGSRSKLYIVEDEVQPDTPEMVLLQGWKSADVWTKLYQ